MLNADWLQGWPNILGQGFHPLCLGLLILNLTARVVKAYLVSLVATNTTGLGASPWLIFCRLMTDWDMALIPEVYGLPLAGKFTAVA